MNYVRESDKAILSLYAIRDLFPNMSIPEGADLRDVGFFKLVPTDAPNFDPDTQFLADAAPVKDGDAYRQAWSVSSLTQEQITAKRKALVPVSVSKFQAKAALLNAGRLSAVEAIMGNPATPELMRLAWTEAQEFRSDSPTVAAMAAALGLSEEDVDNLFIYAIGVTA